MNHAQEQKVGVLKLGKMDYSHVMLCRYEVGKVAYSNRSHDQDSEFVETLQAADEIADINNAQQSLF